MPSQRHPRPPMAHSLSATAAVGLGLGLGLALSAPWASEAFVPPSTHTTAAASASAGVGVRVRVTTLDRTARPILLEGSSSGGGSSDAAPSTPSSITDISPPLHHGHDHAPPHSDEGGGKEDQQQQQQQQPQQQQQQAAPLWAKCVNAVVPRTMPLNEAVSVACSSGEDGGVSLEEANELIEIGAVWAKLDVIKEEDLLEQYYAAGSSASADDAFTVDGSGKVQYGDLPRGWGGSDHDFVRYLQDEEDLDDYVDRMAKQRYRRVLSPTVVDAGTDIRIYPHPRRFPSCYDINADSVLYEDTTFIVVDKPPMLPTQPDASNYRECCPGCVNDLLGPFTTIDGDKVRRPLICHRVDSCVGGCVVLSKDGNGQKVFSQLQRERKLKKLYLTVTTQPVPLGMHIHWMWAGTNKRGQMSGPSCQFVSHTPPSSRRKARQSWIRCVLEVVKCEPINVAKQTENGNGHTYDPGDVQHYQSTIRLVTGRKHQVRAQLASLGCPLIRDTLYGPIAGMTLDSLADEKAEEAMDDAVARCRIPAEPIGLQAHAILFGGIRAKARTPWWGDGS